MYILTIRSDKPEAELCIYQDTKLIDSFTWLAHRELSITIHEKIKERLEKQNLNLQNIEGVVVYKGPGSFTGLRIGITVANALAYSLKAEITGESGDMWVQEGINKLINHQTTSRLIMPEYGAEPNITQQKK